MPYIWQCLFCQRKQTSSRERKFCNNYCQGLYRNKLKIDDWLKTGAYSRGVKKYVLELQDHKCSICHMEDVWMGKSLVFILDHIDGNSENNLKSNLRCVCPNCESQLDTYKSKNKGSGRHYRRQRYKNGQSF